MIDRRLDRLMNQEIDGANSPAESAMLQKALETSGEARARYESLRAAQEILRRQVVIEVWDGLTFLLIFLALVSAEWSLRKWWGLL